MQAFYKYFLPVMNHFLKVFGDIKIFKWPMLIVYDPSGYQVKGDEVREVINIVKPGDILLRGYNKYLDGLFIPGYFSHAGLYLGEVRPEHSELVNQDKREEYFRAGEQIVAHAMAEGVFMEDLINFCRCDRMIILRFPEQISINTGSAVADIPTNNFNSEELSIFKNLATRNTLRFEDAFKTIFKVALRQIGKPYDFQFNFSNYNNLSCTEFVEYCFKSLEQFHNLNPTRKKFLIFAKELIPPDAFIRSKFDIAWQSKSNDPKKIERIMNLAK
jgi:Permuted papain-like amidase enzyme, YaeF/YiiX, C92 family